MSTASVEHPHDHGHGDGHGDGHGHDAEHAANPHLAHHFDTPEQQFSTGKLGIWLFLATEILMFGGLFCAYAVYRYNHPEVYLWAHRALDAKWGMINTIVLLASSFTMAWGVRAAQLNQRGLLLLMLGLTFLGGVGFMCIKGIEYKTKWEHHLFPGRFNSLNAQYEPRNGANADEMRAETIYAVEHHGEEMPGEHGVGKGNLQDKDKKPGEPPAAGHSGTPSNNTETAARSGGGSPHVENNAPNPGANEHPNVAAGANHDQPATSQPTGMSASVMPIGIVNAADANAGTPDVANITPPVFVASGLNADADKPAEHHWTTYAQMELTDRAQLNTFFSIYFMMTGLHGIHVLVGMGIIVWLGVRAFNGEFSSQYFTPVDLGGLYWHLVDLIWIFLFPLLYLIH